MINWSDTEYLEMLQHLSDEQYGELEDEADEEIYTFQEKVQAAQTIVDLTDAKKEQILEKLHDHRNFSVGQFLIKITRYIVRPGNQIFINLSLYEKENNGKIISRVDIQKDNRFTQTSWKKFFNKFNYSEEVPINVFAEIIKWLQISNNLSSFF